jgi:hypothetical protein
LFDESKGGCSEFGKFRQGHHGGSKTFSLDESWVSLDLGMERVFLVEIGEYLLTCL